MFSSSSVAKSAFVSTITISKDSLSAKAMNLSSNDKFGFGFFIANTIIALFTLAIGGLTNSVSLSSISSSTPFLFSSSIMFIFRHFLYFFLYFFFFLF